MAYIFPPGTSEILVARESLDHGLEQLADLPRAEFRDGNSQLAGGILFAEDARGDGIFDGAAGTVGNKGGRSVFNPKQDIIGSITFVV